MSESLTEKVSERERERERGVGVAGARIIYEAHSCTVNVGFPIHSESYVNIMQAEYDKKYIELEILY